MYFKENNDIIDEKKRRLMKILILLIYFLKVLNMINGTKYIKKKSKSQPEETIDEKVKLRKQKADDKDLPPVPPLEGPLEGDEEEVKEGKGLKILTLNKS